MKGFLTGMMVTAPITAILLYFVLAGQNETVVQQERHVIKQEIEELKFDDDFDKAWEGVTTSAKEAKKKTETRTEKIAMLEDKLADFDREFNETFEQSKQDTKAAREVIEEVEVDWDSFDKEMNF